MSETKPYNMRMPVELMERAKAAAEASGVTVTAYILGALERRLAQPLAAVKVEGGVQFPPRAVGSLLKAPARKEKR